ncbi:MAG: glycosyltransferase, partial [Thermoplasmata archaeon]|nr:glycosyltransferase [Thermoplasmata archaeon]
MRISVVVTAYGRKQFLREAVASVDRQERPDGLEVELLVAKNFPDDEIDRREDVTLYDCSNTAAGVMMAEATERARGDVVAFLEDDDLWEPNKLSRVAHAFQAHPELGYFGHGQKPIDAAGRPIPGAGAMWGLQKRISGENYLAPPLGPSASWVLAANPGNVSSVALRRELLMERAPFLRRLKASLDDFLLWAGLLSGRGVLITPEALTRLRVHTENYSRGGRSSFQEYVRRYRRMRAEEIVSHQVGEEMAEGSPWVQEPIRRKIVEFEHFLHVMNA